MLKSHEFWMLTAVGALALVLSGVNMWLFYANRALQDEASSRAQFIQQSIALENLYRQIVKELADRAVRTRDDQIRDMLSGEGINLTFDAPPAGGSEAKP